MAFYFCQWKMWSVPIFLGFMILSENLKSPKSPLLKNPFNPLIRCTMLVLFLKSPQNLLSLPLNLSSIK
jgi:hypothetical protein